VAISACSNRHEVAQLCLVAKAISLLTGRDPNHSAYSSITVEPVIGLVESCFPLTIFLPPSPNVAFLMATEFTDCISTSREPTHEYTPSTAFESDPNAAPIFTKHFFPLPEVSHTGNF
jgi:hypothetical protein